MTTPGEGQEFPLIDLETEPIDPSVEKVIQSHLILRYKVIPIRREGSKLVVAMVDPTSIFALDDMRLMTGFEIECRKITEAQFDEYLAKNPQWLLSIFNETEEALRTAGIPSESAGEAAETTNGVGVVRVVNVIIENALKRNARLINIVPDRRQVRVIYKVDDVWEEFVNFPRYVHKPIINRLKVMAEMNLMEHRMPQTGFMSLRHEKQDYRTKIEILPTSAGESAQIEISKIRPIREIESPGITPDDMVRLETILAQNCGMVICFAPTWSAPHELLHPLIYKVANNNRNVILIEEINSGDVLPLIQVMWTNKKCGLNLLYAAQKVCRLDFDVVAFDGVDLGSAQTLIEATDRLVIIAMTAESVEDVINRFVYHFEIKPRLLAHRVKAVLGLVKNTASITFDINKNIKAMKL